MKKSILALFIIALVATPCFAQEVETDGLFSIEGTEWRYIGVALTITPPFILLYNETMMFVDRRVLTTSGNTGNPRQVGNYFDFLVFSVALADIMNLYVWRDDLFTMVLQPTLGIGMFSSVILQRRWPSPTIIAGFGFGYMFKINDNWTPPGVE